MIQSKITRHIKRRVLDALIRLQNDATEKRIQESLGQLKRCGKQVELGTNVSIYGPKYIEIGDNTKIQSGSRIQAVDHYAPSGQRFDPHLIIGSRCFIEFHVHIGACYHVEIGNDVMLASGVYISDHQHRYDDTTKPVSCQPVTENGRIVIGDGCFVGEGACIFSDVVLGKHVVVGANAVVTKSVPSYCVVAGVPGRILRHYSVDLGEWIAGAPSAT